MRRLLVALLAALALGAQAQTDAETQRIRHLEERLRCLVCQNQTLADSNAELAGDLRREVREQVKAGRSDQQIVDFLVARYGDFVLYDPPLKSTTLLLWLGPFALLLAAIGVVVAVARRRRRAPEEPALDAAGRELAAKALGEEERG